MYLLLLHRENNYLHSMMNLCFIVTKEIYKRSGANGRVRLLKLFISSWHYQVSETVGKGFYTVSTC